MKKIKKIIIICVASAILLSNNPIALANPNSSSCKKFLSNIKKMDDKNAATWKKFDLRRDSMSTLNFNNTEYKGNLSLLKSIYQADIRIFNSAGKKPECFTQEYQEYISTSYDSTISGLAELNTIIYNSSKNSEAKFTAMKETIWLWIAGVYMNYYTLDGRRF